MSAPENVLPIRASSSVISVGMQPISLEENGSSVLNCLLVSQTSWKCPGVQQKNEKREERNCLDKKCRSGYGL